MASSSAATTSYRRTPLFGGAITCDIPSTWKDVSEVRQVPDHQECYQSMDGSGQVLIIEILGREDDVTDADAANHFFTDLAEANGSPASHNRFETLPITTGTQMQNAVVCGGIGYQRVEKKGFTMMGPNGQALINQPDTVDSIKVELCVFRLANVETDLLVTLSKPVAANPNEPTAADVSCFERVVSTLTIQDWGLFG